MKGSVQKVWIVMYEFNGVLHILNQVSINHKSEILLNNLFKENIDECNRCY